MDNPQQTMPTSRRKRGPSVRSLFTLAALLFTTTASAAYAVLGVDLGTGYIKAALVKPGIPLEIVLTKDSKRKEVSAIAFKAARNQVEQDPDTFPERLYGGDALALSARIPAEVYPNLKHLLGATEPFQIAVFQDYKNRYPAIQMEESARSINLRSKAFGFQDEVFTVEELLAMELKVIRQNAEAMAGTGSVVREAVFTIPPFYTVDERRAIETAAELADMKVMALVTDGLAVGVNYATSRTFEKPETHLIYDMGAGYTSATIVRFQGKTVKDVGKFNKTVQEVAVLGTGWDRTLGGDILNDLVVDHMINSFSQTKAARTAQISASDVKKNGRTMVKLNREAEKVRQVLSANSATSAFFEGLQDDVDFRYKLTRVEFEELTATIGSRVGVPITEALTKAKLDLTSIDSIILHGGVVRTPFVQAALESAIGDALKLKSNVNSDEAAVFGAAFKAAKLSPSFRVKEIRDIDVANYPISMHWKSGEKGRKQGLFIGTSQVGNVKQVPVKMQDDFAFSLSQSVPAPGTDELVNKPLSEVTITNLTATVAELEKSYSCVRSNISTNLDLQLDPATGLPQLLKAYVSCVSDVVEKKGGVMDGVKGLFGFGKDSQKPLNDDDDDDVELDLEAETTTEITTTTPTRSKTKKTKSGATTLVTPTPKLHVIPLSFNTRVIGKTGPSNDELKQMRDRLAQFDKSDAARRTREETFNSLEGLTYRVRDMLTDESFMAVSSPDQRSSIEKLLGETSEWIYGEGSSAGPTAIREKLSGLLALVSPVQERKKELADRPRLIESLETTLNQSQSIMSIVRSSIDRAASAAASVAKAATSTVAEEILSITSNVAQAVSTATGSREDADELEDVSTTFSSVKPSSTSYKAPILDTISQYTEEDYTKLSELYTSVKTWLSEQQLAQAGLHPFEDPVLTSADMNRKSEQLNDLTSSMLRKLTRTPPKSSSKKTARPKTSKTSGGATSITSGSQTATDIHEETETASPVVDEEPEAEETPRTNDEAVGGKDEL